MLCTNMNKTGQFLQILGKNVLNGTKITYFVINKDLKK